jgi:hypothetical protein
MNSENQENITLQKIKCVRNWLEGKHVTSLEKCDYYLVSSAFVGAQVGTIIAMPVCGALASSSIGWPSIFYVFGALGICWALLWVFLGADHPATHRFISKAEQAYIETNLGSTLSTDTVCDSSHSRNRHLYNNQTSRLTRNTSDFIQ